MRDSSFFLSPTPTRRRTVRSSSSLLLDRERNEDEDEDSEGPARPAARRVPWTDDLSIFVNDLAGAGAGAGAGGDAARARASRLLALASSEARDGAPEGMWTGTKAHHVSSEQQTGDRRRRDEGRGPENGERRKKHVRRRVNRK